MSTRFTMSLCFLSLESSKIFNKLILEKMEELGFDGLSESLIILFPFIEASEKITVSKLSKQVGYSRQAMHKNIKKLEDYGYITLVLENQKEKIILLSEKSNSLILEANKYINSLENDISKLIGQKELEKYKSNQLKIHEFLKSV